MSKLYCELENLIQQHGPKEVLDQLQEVCMDKGDKLQKHHLCADSAKEWYDAGINLQIIGENFNANL